MLVLRGKRAGIPASEQTVIGWLEGLDLAGVAISGTRVRVWRHHNGQWSAQGAETDLIVMTPQGCVVIEVKGVKKPVDGVLSCPVNGGWTMTGVEGTPVNVREGDTNPIDQAVQAMYGFKNLISKASPGPGTFVLALIAVMPIPGHTVSLNPDRGEIPMPPGCEILITPGPDALLSWFTAQQRGTKPGPGHRREPPWTAQRALRVLDVLLQQPGEVTLSALHTAGFRNGTRKPAPAPPAAAAPSPPASQPAAVAGPERGPDITARPPAPARPPVAVEHDLKPSVPHPIRTLALGVAVLAAIGTAVWGFAGCTSSATSRQDAPAPTETVRTQATPAPAKPPPPVAEEPEPAPAPHAPPRRPAGCFPFQQDC